MDSDRGVIRATPGKGKKDRDTSPDEATRAALREYCTAYRPKEWLFPGEKSANPSPREPHTGSLSGQ